MQKQQADGRGGSSDAERPGVLCALLVEDDDSQASAIADYLDAATSFRFEAKRARALREALAPEQLTGVDVVLLDLNLPDSNGIETLETVREHAPDVPIVVLTGMSDQRLEASIMRSGAQDYLPKGSFTPELLARSMFYAVERKLLQKELLHAREEARHERELRAIAEMGSPRSTVTAQLLGETSLREGSPAAFDELAGRFVALGTQALDEQTYRTEGPGHRAELQKLAGELGALRAGPQDIVDIYREALERFQLEGGESAVAQRDEARVTLIGLMGLVLAYYRLRATTSDREHAGGASERAQGPRRGG